MFDLHVHTTASDGEYDAKGIIQEALRVGVTKMAITDHDTVGNVIECIEEGKKQGVLVLSGVELSARYDGGQMHILGLGVDCRNEQFKNVLEEQAKARDDRNERIVKTLEDEFGIKISYDDIKKNTLGNVIGKPHIARAIIEKGYEKNVQDVFEKYLNKPVIKQIKRVELEPKEAIDLIHSANGLAVLAHSVTLKLSKEDTYKKILELKEMGLDGIEVYHSKHSEDDSKYYLEIAEKEGLIITCGSDFHGQMTKPDVELGKGKNNNLPTNSDEIFDNVYNSIKMHR